MMSSKLNIILFADVGGSDWDSDLSSLLLDLKSLMAFLLALASLCFPQSD